MEAEMSETLHGPGTPRSGGRRKWLLIPLLGGIMLLLVGVGTFLLARSYEGSKASQSCDIWQCIPRLEAAKVAKALQDEGYTCTQNLGDWNCKLQIGYVSFEVRLLVAEELIHDMEASISQADGELVTETGLPFLNWFATLPYSQDAQTSAQIEAWVTEQVNGKKATEATIGNYRYELTNPRPSWVNLNIEGNFE
jgi:hypothetical protein